MFKGIFPVIVHDGVKHSDVRCGMGDATSAGFCDINVEEKTVTVYGESTSLKLKPVPYDKELLERFLFDP